MARRPWWPRFVLVAALVGAGVEAWHVVRELAAPPPAAAPAEPTPDPRWFAPLDGAAPVDAIDALPQVTAGGG